MALDDDRTLIDDGRRSGNARRGDIPNALPPGTRMGEFEIVRAIGAGGFGIVYLTLDHSLGRHVALKEYMPLALATRVHPVAVTVRSSRDAGTFAAGLRSFINEAKLLAQFDHPSLVKVYRFWEANGTAYMVMPYYEGQTLAKYLRQAPDPPDEAWLRNLLTPLLDALQQLHSAHCFHRDIAPDNILLLPDGSPLLLDFGAARRVIGDMTRTLTVILKPGYAPVEQYGESHDLKQGPWTDLYALSCVVYFAILGITPPAAIQRLLKDRCHPLAHVAGGQYSRPFLQAIDRALAVLPKDRPQSVAELQALLKPDDSARRPQRRARPLIVASVAACCIALLAGLGYWMVDDPQATPGTTAATRAPPAMVPRAEPVVPVLSSGTSADELPPLAVPQPRQAAVDKRASSSKTRPPESPPTAPVTLHRPAPPERASEHMIPTSEEEPPGSQPKAAVASHELPRRCEDIIHRFSLGEPLNAEEREYLKEACKP